MIKNNNKQKTNTKTSNYVIQNKLELWSSFLLAFFKLTKTKQQIIIKEKKTKRECDEFRKGDIVGRARDRESESEERMSPRGEAKQEKGTHEKERERES